MYRRRRVDVMPTNPQKNYQGGGITLEDLKAQTYRRLAEEEGNIESNSHDVALRSGGQKHSTASMNANYPRHHPHHPRFQQPREQQQQYAPVQHYGSPHNRYPHPRGPMNYGHPPPPNFGGGYAYDVHHHHQPNPCYEQTSRNYTDSQLGLKGSNGSRSLQQSKNKNMQQPISLPITHQQHLSSPPPPNYYPNPQPLQQQQQQLQYSTPRMPRHAAVLKDRGSAENSSVGSDQPTNINGGSSSSSYGYENRGNARPTPNNSRAALLYKGTTAATTTSGKQPQRSPVNGRFTPTREHHLESQVLFATPNQRRDAVPSTPSSCYSEPPRSKPVGNNYTRIKSPVHAPPARAQDAQQQKQLPAHGLTVHELKEMTRARLAERREQQGRLATGAEDIPGGVSGGEGLSSDQSVHSVGTHGSTKSGPCKLSNEPVTRNLVQSNDSVRYQGQQQMHNIPQYNNYPRHPSPEFGTTGGKEPQFNGFNRGRCFSAEATTGVPSSSFEQHQASYYDNVPLTGTANRQRCATVSPPGMSRLHEDRPFLFSKDDKDRLAIPPLSEPRMRLHSTGGLNTNGTAVRAFSSSVSPPPTEGAVTVSNGRNKANEEFTLLSPPATVNLTSPSSMNRSKFSANDRTISTGSAASGLGDLPSSMAEAVLESLTSANAPKMSPFRSSEQGFVGESPYRVSGESSDNSSSAFRLPGLAESSGSMSLFSSGEPQNIFVPSDKSSGDDRMLLGTHSWGGADDEGGLSHDFSNLLNFAADDVGSPPARTRAVTEPSWIGESGRSLVSRIDPEVNDERKAPPHRVSSDNAGR